MGGVNYSDQSFENMESNANDELVEEIGNKATEHKEPTSGELIDEMITILEKLNKLLDKEV